MWPLLRAPDPTDGGSPLPENNSDSSSPIPPETNPEIQKGQQSDDSTAGNAAAKGSLLERIRQAGHRVNEKWGITFRKGPGRPRKDGLPGVSDEVIDAPKGFQKDQGAISFVDGSPVDQATVSLCRRSIVAAVKAFDWLAKKIVRIKAEAAQLPTEFIDRALKTAEPDAKALDDFQASLDAVLRKHNFKPENDEEWALAIDAGRLFAPYLLLLATFNAEIERRKSLDLKKAVEARLDRKAEETLEAVRKLSETK